MKSKTLIARFKPQSRWIVTIHTTATGFRYNAFKTGKKICTGEAVTKEGCAEAARSAVERYETLGLC